MPTRRTRGGTFTGLEQAASNLLVPLGLFYAARHQKSRLHKSRKHRKHYRKTQKSYYN